MSHTFSKTQLPLAEGDVIEGDAADLTRPEPQKVGQMNNGIGSDIRRGFQ